jgi:hypothetical protein
MRPLYAIAHDVRRYWPNVKYSAEPYLRAMAQMNSVADSYGYDSGKSVVRYFLGNAQNWRGADAKRIKDELKEMIA